MSQKHIETIRGLLQIGSSVKFIDLIGIPHRASIAAISDPHVAVYLHSTREIKIMLANSLSQIGGAPIMHQPAVSERAAIALAEHKAAAEQRGATQRREEHQAPRHSKT